jgi:hypothetical protein
MPSARYYGQQAKALLAWAKATKNTADFHLLIAQFNDQQMRKSP